MLAEALRLLRTRQGLTQAGLDGVAAAAALRGMKPGARSPRPAAGPGRLRYYTSAMAESEREVGR